MRTNGIYIISPSTTFKLQYGIICSCTDWKSAFSDIILFSSVVVQNLLNFSVNMLQAALAGAHTRILAFVSFFNWCMASTIVTVFPERQTIRHLFYIGRKCYWKKYKNYLLFYEFNVLKCNNPVNANLANYYIFTFV